jgi:hypothetical protein
VHHNVHTDKEGLHAALSQGDTFMDDLFVPHKCNYIRAERINFAICAYHTAREEDDRSSCERRLCFTFILLASVVFRRSRRRQHPAKRSSHNFD